MPSRHERVLPNEKPPLDYTHPPVIVSTLDNVVLVNPHIGLTRDGSPQAEHRVIIDMIAGALRATQPRRTFDPAWQLKGANELVIDDMSGMRMHGTNGSRLNFRLTRFARGLEILESIDILNTSLAKKYGFNPQDDGKTDGHPLIPIPKHIT